MENKTVGIIISVAIAVLMGAILISIIADNINEKTSLVTYTDSVDIGPVRDLPGGGINYTANERLYASEILTNPAGSTWRGDIPDCTISSVAYYNQSGALMSNSADYTWVEDGNNVDGWLRPKNVVNLNSSASNTTTIVYSTCPVGYVSGWSKTVTQLVPGFFALAILITCVFVIFYVLRQEGVDVDLD